MSLADDIARWSQLTQDAYAARREFAVGSPDCRRCDGVGSIILAAPGALDELREIALGVESPQGIRVETSDFAPPGTLYRLVCPECSL